MYDSGFHGRLYSLQNFLGVSGKNYDFSEEFAVSLFRVINCLLRYYCYQLDLTLYIEDSTE